MNRNYPTLFTNRVDMGMLRRALKTRAYGHGQTNDRLPADMEGVFIDMPVYGMWPRELHGLFTVVVNKTSNPKGRRGAGKHRVFILTDKGQRIPAGRAAQTKLI